MSGINPNQYAESINRLNKMCNLNLIDLKNANKKQQIFCDILNLLKSKISEFPPNSNLRLCSEFLAFVCNILEEVHKDEKKVNKKEICINLYRHLFNITEPEAKILESTIDFIHANNLINTIPKAKKVFFSLKKKAKSWF
jgi:hypothetical protein